MNCVAGIQFVVWTMDWMINRKIKMTEGLDIHEKDMGKK